MTKRKTTHTSAARGAGDDDDGAPLATPSVTAAVSEALRTGVLPGARVARGDAIPHEDLTIQAGDPDDDVLENEYAGENLPGASAPTPDQNQVDEIGRAYGLEEEDNGPLRAASEILARRDRHRSELRAPRRPTR